MKFGKALTHQLIPGWEASYVNYEHLKHELKVIAALKKTPTSQSASGSLGPRPSQHVHVTMSRMGAGRAPNSDPIGVFMQEIDHELVKINHFAEAKQKELVDGVAAANLKVQALQNSPDSADALALVKRVDEIAAILCDLEAFVQLNGLAVEKICKKCDKMLGTTLLPVVRARLEGEPFMSLPTTKLFVPLSQLYTALRTMTESSPAAGSDGGAWVPPSSFVRKTTKYWVPYEHIPRLKAMIIKHLPVLVYGKSGKLEKLNLRNKDQALSTDDGQNITSVYFDNDAFSFYQTRLRRDEGAQLFRIRWYGPPTVPSAKSVVFMERKTHHESWTGMDSVKERFDLPVSRVPRFLHGEDVVKPYYSLLVDDGVLSADKAAVQTALSDEMQLVMKTLTAKVRTVYRRTAFQRDDTNDVRISLDTSLQMFREVPVEGRAASFGDGFCAPNTELGDANRSYHFPYAVLEVKLSGSEEPTWVSNILARCEVVEVKKFSKFLSGVAFLYPNDVTLCPHWITEDGRLRLPDPVVPPETVSQPEPEESKDSESRESSGLLSPQAPEQMQLSESPEREMVVAVADPADTVLGPQQHQTGGQGGDLASQSQPRRQGSWFRKFVSPGPEAKEPKHRRMVPVRVEPKVFFANERTFLTWISMTIFLVTLSATLLAISPNTLPTAVTFGVIAVLMLAYATFRFLYRSKMIAIKSVESYDDRIGPVVVVMAIAAALIASMVVASQPRPFQPINYTAIRTVRAVAGKCESLIHAAGATPLSPGSRVVSPLVRPTGLFVHDALRAALVASPFSLSVVPLNGDSPPAQTLSLPNQNVTAITVAASTSETVFLGCAASGVGSNAILEYDMATERVKRSWDLDDLASVGTNASVQGLAFVPNPDNEEGGTFWLAGMGDVMYELQLPLVSNSSSLNLAVVNALVVSMDLAPDHPAYRLHISDLSYDATASIMYVMYSMLPQVRAYRLPGWVEVARFELPGGAATLVDLGLWKGLHVTDNGTTMYLAQHMPPRVFKVAVWRGKIDAC
jgi:SPX domain protein involved in polyphosphate accumulation/uncharacterized membrane protein YidH (DUF202 family)